MHSKTAPNSQRSILDLFNYANLAQDLVEDVLDELSLSERDFVEMRYGLGEYIEDGIRSLKEVSEVYGKSSACMHRFESNVFTKVKNILGSRMRKIDKIK